MERARRNIGLDDKIESAQGKVVRTKAKYDAAVSELKLLMEKREALRKDALMKAIASSSKSHDEILAFLKGESGSE
jgi:hypothetical protein